MKENNLLEASEIEKKMSLHPCFNREASSNERIHLPVAPKCNIQCNYCVRKFDCANESRPGVTTRLLTPEEAFEKYKETKQMLKKLSVVGIAGPGDALCDFENTKKTLQLIRDYDPDITFCLSTNGLLLPKYAQELIRLGVSHVTVTMNSVSPEISAKIYKYIRYEGKEYTGEEAGVILRENQLKGLKILIENGVVCKVNIVLLKGINDKHIPEIATTVKELGCYIVNIMPFIPVCGSAFENMQKTPVADVLKIRETCETTILQMHHCRQCRADAVGSL